MVGSAALHRKPNLVNLPELNIKSFPHRMQCFLSLPHLGKHNPTHKRHFPPAERRNSFGNGEILVILH